MPDQNPSYGHIALCGKCFAVARSAEGRILGYVRRDGKTRAYVKEELFG